MKKALLTDTKITGLTALVVLLGLGAQAQSVDFTFSDGSSDGWADAGFSGTPASSVVPIGGQNYIAVPVSGFQDGNVASDSSGVGNAGVVGNFNNAMQAALINPAGYDISYTYSLNTASGWSGATYLQLGIFVNTGKGYYAQDYSTPNQTSFSGAQLASGSTFTGTITENLATLENGSPDANAGTETYWRLGLIENSNGTGAVDYTSIEVTPIGVPEPSSLALIGAGLVGLTVLRRRA